MNTYHIIARFQVTGEKYDWFVSAESKEVAIKLFEDFCKGRVIEEVKQVRAFIYQSAPNRSCEGATIYYED